MVISGHQPTWSIKEPKAGAIVTPRPLGALTGPSDLINVSTPCLYFLASEDIQRSEPFVDVGQRHTCGEIPRRSEHMHAGQAAPSVSGAPRTGNQGRSHLARARRRWPLDECRRVRRPPSLTEPQAPRARGTAASDLMRHAIRGHQWPSVVIRPDEARHQWPSVVIRPDEARHRGSSVVIRPDEARHRRSSVVIRPDEARHRRSSGALWFTHVYTQVTSGGLRWPQVHSGAIRCNQTVGLVDRVQI